MMSKSVHNLALALITCFVLTAFSTLQTEKDPKAKSLIKALEETNGGWKHLASKIDVQYTYVYKDFQRGTDLSTEKYIFNGEASWAEYSQHEVNVMPDTEGMVRQRLVNGEAGISVDGKVISDPQAVGGSKFLRIANFYWFTMMYKINDPGTYHKYMGQEEMNGITYEKVSVSYDPEALGKDDNDEYILYLNPETHLVDQFMFSFPGRGVMKPVLKMELDYTKIDGVYIATTRRLFAPNEQGEYAQLGEFVSKDVTFNNGFTEADLAL